MKTYHVPKKNWKKLWNYCLRTSETGTIPVQVLSSDRNGYYLLRTDARKRIGRAIPEIRRHQTFTSVSWSYVY